MAVVLAIVVWGVAMAGVGLVFMAADRVDGSVALGPSGLVGSPALQALLLAAVLCLAIGGAADMASAAFRSTMLMEAAEDDVRGRLQGVFFVVVVGGPRIADTLHGAGGEVVGPGPATAIGGVLVVVLVVVAALAAPVFTRYRVVR